jgi:plastocyanin
MRSSRTLAALTAAAALAIAGCGGDDEEAADSTPAPGGSGGGQTVKLAADAGGALKFDKAELTAKAGPVTLSMDNPSDVPHAVQIEGEGEPGETVTKDGVSEATADLKAGTYTYYCPVGSHRAAGMEGKLTVQ